MSIDRELTEMLALIKEEALIGLERYNPQVTTEAEERHRKFCADLEKIDPGRERSIPAILERSNAAHALLERRMAEIKEYEEQGLTSPHFEERMKMLIEERGLLIGQILESLR